jgi:hypothetical protein
MSRYRVSFYKHLVSSYGRSFKALQAKFELPAESAAEAEIEAERQFEYQQGISDWHPGADTVETESGAKGGPLRRSPRSVVHVQH